MTYLHPEKVKTDNVYSYWGTISHDLVQSVYDNTHSWKELPTLFDDSILEWRISYSDMYKFPSENIEKSYINNLNHYFQNFEKLPFEIENELPIKIVIDRNGAGKIVFIGYIDSIYHTEDGHCYILDYKTSSISGFTGKQLLEHSKQLLLYAIGVHQLTGLPYDKIHPRFDMLKYVQIDYLQKNGKWKSTIKERIKIVESQKKKIQKLLEDAGYDPIETEEMIQRAINENSFDSLPPVVTEKFKVSNAYIDVPFDEKIISDLEEWIIHHVEDCERKEKGDLKSEFPQPRLDENGNEFYFKVLAPQLLHYLDDYIDRSIANDLDDFEYDSLDDLFK
ncbi:TPA: PD-(D/E)XK nuclease family protein [Streptococcus suis]